MIASRRRFLFGAASTGLTLVAAPAIVRTAANLMPISTAAIDKPPSRLQYHGYENLNDLITTTLRNRSDVLARTIMKNNAILRAMQDKDLMHFPGESLVIFTPNCELDENIT